MEVCAGVLHSRLTSPQLFLSSTAQDLDPGPPLCSWRLQADTGGRPLLELKPKCHAEGLKKGSVWAELWPTLTMAGTWLPAWFSSGLTSVLCESRAATWRLRSLLPDPRGQSGPLSYCQHRELMPITATGNCCHRELMLRNLYPHKSDFYSFRIAFKVSSQFLESFFQGDRRET